MGQHCLIVKYALFFLIIKSIEYISYIYLISSLPSSIYIYICHRGALPLLTFSKGRALCFIYYFTILQLLVITGLLSSVPFKVNLNVKQGGKRLEHQGIRIEFVGQIGEPD